MDGAPAGGQSYGDARPDRARSRPRRDAAVRAVPPPRGRAPRDPPVETPPALAAQTEGQKSLGTLQAPHRATMSRERRPDDPAGRRRDPRPRGPTRGPD